MTSNGKRSARCAKPPCGRSGNHNKYPMNREPEIVSPCLIELFGRCSGLDTIPGRGLLRYAWLAGPAVDTIGGVLKQNGEMPGTGSHTAAVGGAGVQRRAGRRSAPR